MSDNAQLARTGTAAGAIVIGSTVITGWYILAIALAIVLVGAVLVRFTFRPGLTASQSSLTTDPAEVEPEAGQS